MTEMRKIMAVAIVIAMACASMIIVSPNNTVTAEDSAKPLAGLDTGYPDLMTVTDQEQLSFDDLWALNPAGTEAAQGFFAGMDGDLVSVDILIDCATDVGNLYCEIRDDLNGVSISSTEVRQFALLLDGPDYNEILFDTPATLTQGVPYYIVMWADADVFDWAMDSSTLDPYPGEAGYENPIAWQVIGDGTWDLVFATHMEVAHPGINKVAWHADGSYALGVTGMDGDDVIYKYTRQTGAWQVEFDQNIGDTFSDIEYSEDSGNFYIVGDGAGQPMAWRYVGGGLNDLFAPNIAGAGFIGLGLADEMGVTTFAFFAVGYNAGAPYAAWFEEPNTWTQVATGWTADHVLYDVAWNQQPTGSVYHAVGEDINNGNGIMYSFGIGDTNAVQTDVTGTGALRAIDYQDVFMGPGLIAGDNVGNGNVFTFDEGVFEPILDTAEIIEDISWHPSDPLAMLVGYNGIDQGVIYHYTPDNNDAVTKISTDGDYGKLYGVDVKGWTSPSSGLIVGASGAIGSYLSAEDTGTRLTVNAAFPHMYDIDMWETSDAGQASTLNTQVDIDDTYTFYTEINYTIDGVDELFDIGNVNNTFIDLTAWYDEGVEALMPLSDDTHRTKKFVARFYEGVAGTAGVAGTMIYPTGSPGTDEIAFDSVGCSGPFGIDDRYAVWINVTFGRQMRAAAGPFGGASTDIFDTGNSFNGADSWNFQMEVYDNDFPGASNTTYEEFGTFMYTNISITGNPSVNAPPGSVNEFMAPNSFITYSANTPYYVNVSIPDLTSGGDSIAATEVNISLVGAFPAGFDYNPYTEINASWGTFGSPFAAAGSERMVWGNLSEVNYLIDPTDNGTTAYGPWGSDFNGYGATEIEWWVSVPGATPEGIYQATITFKIGYW